MSSEAPGPGTGRDPDPIVWPGAPGVVETNPEARLWAMFCHLAALCGIILPFIGNIVGPIIVWAIRKDRHPFVDDQGKEAINFQITVTIAILISAVLMLALIGFILVPIIFITSLILLIIAGVQANTGVRYRYPINIRFIK